MAHAPAKTRKRGRPAAQYPQFGVSAATLSYNIIRLAQLKRNRDDAMFRAEAGISLSHAMILGLLDRTPSASAGQLARALMITPQSIGPQIDELEALGLVARSGRRRRGEANLVAITSAGHRKYMAIAAVTAHADREVSSNLTPAELRQFSKYLLRLLSFYGSLADSPVAGCVPATCSTQSHGQIPGHRAGKGKPAR